MPNWEEIRREWETTKITFAKFAEKHDVKLGTLKSRRSREGWVEADLRKMQPRRKKMQLLKRLQPLKRSL